MRRIPQHVDYYQTSTLPRNFPGLNQQSACNTVRPSSSFLKHRIGVRGCVHTAHFDLFVNKRYRVWPRLTMSGSVRSQPSSELRQRSEALRHDLVHVAALLSCQRLCTLERLEPPAGTAVANPDGGRAPASRRWLARGLPINTRSQVGI